MGLFNKVFGKPKNTQASQPVPVPLTPRQEYVSLCELFDKQPYQDLMQPGNIAYFTYAPVGILQQVCDHIAVFDDERLYWRDYQTGQINSISVRSIQDWRYTHHQVGEFVSSVVGLYTVVGDERALGLEKAALENLISCIQAIQNYDHSVKNNMNDEELFNEVLRHKHRMAMAGGMNCDEVYPEYFDDNGKNKSISF